VTLRWRVAQAEEAGEDEVERMGARGRRGGGARGPERGPARALRGGVPGRSSRKRRRDDLASANLGGKPAIHKLQVLPELTTTLRKSVSALPAARVRRTVLSHASLQ